MRVGIDIVFAPRMNEMKASFVQKNFTVYEITYITQIEKSFAGFFAAKEAFLKAIGVGVLNGIDLKDVEVRHKDSGQPYLNVAPEIMKKHKIKDISLSISHDGDYATAIVAVM
ncbi:MAG: holo-ACP synthase [Firmicutes bacterium]|nr:holo-ACP synthase [Bacillota bacterium]MCL2770969.1 holo-ACP synthase [Bacillota bacterium]